MPTISYGLRAMSAEHNPVKLTDWVMSLQDDAWEILRHCHPRLPTRLLKGALHCMYSKCAGNHSKNSDAQVKVGAQLLKVIASAL